MIGSVHLGLGEPANVGEFACLISPASWGQGAAFEVCSAVLDRAFTATALQRAFARCEATNRGSLRVLKKLGLIQEGLLRSHRLNLEHALVDEYWFGILREEWLGAGSA